MRRLLSLVLVSAVLIAGAPAALATDEPPPEPPPVEDTTSDAEEPAPAPRVPKKQVRRIRVTRDIVFPVVGANRFSSTFGNCRDNCEREHHGNDIMTYGWKGVPVVAAHDGWIRKVRDDGEWCNVEITGVDGWYTRYVHLNNDTPGYDDEIYSCIPEGIEPGVWVEAGQLIGWVGDSGNAETTPPHVHFEIRTPRGLPVDPYRSLKKAERIMFYRVNGDDPVTAAAEIAAYAYREGSGVVNIMATTTHEAFQSGGLSTLNLSGPLLLSEPDHLPEATIAALEELNPGRVIIVGDGLGAGVIESLEREYPIVEQMGLPGPIPDSYIEPDSGEEVAIPGPGPTPFSLVIAGDTSDIPQDSRDDLVRSAWTMPTMVFADTDAARKIGRHTYQGPGRSGRKYVLYFQTGDGYTKFRAKEAPETPPNYGVIVLPAHEATEAALTFLASLADAPVLPLWR
ncbi:MAG: M23 family metallopeptidase [Actinomycetota bacterium]